MMDFIIFHYREENDFLYMCKNVHSITSTIKYKEKQKKSSQFQQVIRQICITYETAVYNSEGKKN